MRLTAILFGLVFMCAAFAVAVPPQDGEDVRGAFLTSRPKEKPATSGSAARPSRRRPKATATPVKSTEKTSGTPVGSSSTGSTGSTTNTTAVRPVNVPRLGIGLTLFSRDSNGLGACRSRSRVSKRRSRAAPARNQQRRLSLHLQSHKRWTAGDDLSRRGDRRRRQLFAGPRSVRNSGSDAAEERLRWFAFDQNTGTEKVFFVFTREPLKDVPTEDELIAFCRNNQCPWQAGGSVWEMVQAQAQEPLKSDRAKSFGTAQTRVEQNATTRGLGLAKDDPQPSLIMMASSTKPTLVATLDLIHK